MKKLYFIVVSILFIIYPMLFFAEELTTDLNITSFRYVIFDGSDSLNLLPNEIYMKIFKPSDPEFIIYDNYTVDKDGNIYIADAYPLDGIIRIHKYSILEKAWKIIKTDKNCYNRIRAITLDKEGNIYIGTLLDPTTYHGAFGRYYTVHKYSPTGKFLFAIGSAKINNYILTGIEKLFIDNEDNIWVCHYGRTSDYNPKGKYRFLEYDKSGNFIKELHNLPKFLWRLNTYHNKFSIKREEPKYKGKKMYNLIVGQDNKLYYWNRIENGVIEIHQLTINE